MNLVQQFLQFACGFLSGYSLCRAINSYRQYRKLRDELDSHVGLSGSLGE